MAVIAAYIDHSTAPKSERAGFAFSENQAERCLDLAKANLAISGSILLSTCDRTELWAHIKGEEYLADRLIGILCAAAELPESRCGGAFGVCKGNGAVRRIFETACGLRSRLLFEDQILGQVKAALVLAQYRGNADDILTRLFQSAIACAKKIKTEIADARNPDLLSACVLDAVRMRAKRFPAAPKCLVIGSGTVGKQTAAILQAEGFQAAMTIRKHHPGLATAPRALPLIDYDERLCALAAADVVVGATRSPHLTLCGKDAFDALSDGRGRLLIDLASPADFEPALSGAGHTELVTLEDILAEGGRRNPADAARAAAKDLIDHATAKLAAEYHRRALWRENRA